MKKRRNILMLLVAAIAVMVVMSGCGHNADKSEDKDAQDKDQVESVKVVKPDLKDKTVGTRPPQIVQDDDNALIFYNPSGIFCYDYSKGEITRALDVAAIDTNFPLDAEGDNTAFVIPDKDKNKGDLIILKKENVDGKLKLADYYYVYNLKDNTLEKVNKAPNSQYLDLAPSGGDAEKWVLQFDGQPMTQIGYKTKDGKVINILEKY